MDIFLFVFYEFHLVKNDKGMFPQPTRLYVNHCLFDVRRARNELFGKLKIEEKTSQELPTRVQ